MSEEKLNRLIWILTLTVLTFLAILTPYFHKHFILDRVQKTIFTTKYIQISLTSIFNETALYKNMKRRERKEGKGEVYILTLWEIGKITLLEHLVEENF